MKFKNLEMILQEAYAVHKDLIPRVNFESKNKAHAIYLIQGGVLTATSNAYSFNLAGYYAPTVQQKRLIDESIDLIWFFDENKDESRQIKAWFKGEVVERTPGNSGNLSIEKRAETNFIKKDNVIEIQKLQNEMKNITSKSMHPTLNVMRMGMSKKTYIFDYDNNIPKKPIYNVADFGSMYIIPALYSILTPFRSFPLSKNNFNRLRLYISLIESEK